MQVNAYLSFNGNCAEAFQFYEKTLGGTIEFLMTHGEAPGAEELPAGWRNMVMHARLAAGGQVLLGSDSPPDDYEKPQGITVSLQVDSAAEAERIFDAFADGGTVSMPMEQTFWAERFGMVTDRFGTPWMINFEGNAGA